MSGTSELTGLSDRLARRVGAEHAHLQLVRDFERLMEGAPDWRVSAPGGPRVGVATFGSGGWHFVLEALLAHALAARGAQAQLLICDLPDLPICDERTVHSREIDRCAGCFRDKRALIEASGLPWRGISSLVGVDSLPRARATVAALDDAALEAHVERGWPIGRWLHVSACHYLRCDARGEEPEKIDTRRRLLAVAIVIVEAVERWLDETRPDLLIAESGAHVEWRIAMELARARGIRVTCREMGKGGWDHHLYAFDADCMAPNLDEEWSQIRQVPLSSSAESAVDAFLDQLPAKTYPQRTSSPRGRADLQSSLGIPPGRRIAVAFTNVTWDLATAGRDVAFTSVLDWVRDTIQVVGRHPGTHLILRAHPAEASVTTRERILDQVAREWPGGLSHVTLLQPEAPIAARDLFEIADLVLAYNSTAGLEAASHGCTTIVCGRPHYRGKGFTIDVNSRQDYDGVLAGWANGQPVAAPPNARELARRYFHLFFLRYHVPLGWTTSPLEPPYELLVRSMDELGPGANPVLDLVCDGILNGRQVLLPREAACTP
ncbi:MAG: hypothetical protein ABI665_00375 [Vicinamibacterales bacterium]